MKPKSKRNENPGAQPRRKEVPCRSGFVGTNSSDQNRRIQRTGKPWSVNEARIKNQRRKVMKRIFVLGMLVTALSIGNINPSNAVLLRDETPDRLDPEPEGYCVCSKPVCHCLEDCSFENTLCSLGLPFPLSLICIPIKNACEDDCYDWWGDEPSYTCYPQEPTPYDRITDCTSRCIQKGGTRVDCLMDCGGY
jgi:hypothetical protein